MLQISKCQTESIVPFRVQTETICLTFIWCLFSRSYFATGEWSARVCRCVYACVSVCISALCWRNNRGNIWGLNICWEQIKVTVIAVECCSLAPHKESHIGPYETYLMQQKIYRTRYTIFQLQYLVPSICFHLLLSCITHTVWKVL